jgi:predicted RNA-binding Zn-ribbon protein involved in translation (DUF1610 family)
MEICKVLVSQGDTAVFVCPHCGTSKTVNVAKFKHRGSPLKVKCTCRSTFDVSLECRRVYRKESDLVGYYCPLPVCKDRDWGEMVVKNISLGGIMFSPLTPHNLRKGDEVKVKFRLDDKKRSEIKRTAIVRRLSKDNCLHCEFNDNVQHHAALGFYFMG